MRCSRPFQFRWLIHVPDSVLYACLAQALSASITGDHEAATRMLLAAGSDPVGAIRSTAQGKLQCLKALLELLRSDTLKPRLDSIKYQISETMEEASGQGGHDSVALVLLGACVEFEVDVNQYLSKAAKAGRLDLVHALLAAGAKVRLMPCISLS